MSGTKKRSGSHLREGVEYNLTKIADKYQGLPVPNQIPFLDHTRQINNVGVADVWGCAVKKGGAKTQS